VDGRLRHTGERGGPLGSVCASGSIREQYRDWLGLRPPLAVRLILEVARRGLASETSPRSKYVI
jgi:hypothetical protein